MTSNPRMTERAALLGCAIETLEAVKKELELEPDAGAGEWHELKHDEVEVKDQPYPPESRHVLLYTSRFGGSYEIGYVSRLAGNDSKWFIGSTEGRAVSLGITHWRALPPLPVRSATDGQ